MVVRSAPVRRRFSGSILGGGGVVNWVRGSFDANTVADRAETLAVGGIGGGGSSIVAVLFTGGEAVGTR